MKIFTYKDPYTFKNSNVWKLIEHAPHFCASEVLATGLRKKWGRCSFDCLSTVDELLSNIFPNWVALSSADVKRYVDVADVIDQMSENDVSHSEKNAFVKEKRSVLEAVKYLFETEENLFQADLLNHFKYQDQIQYDFIKFILVPLLKKIKSEGKDYWYPDWFQDELLKANFADAVRKCNIDEVRKLGKIYIEELGTTEQRRENALNWFKNYFNQYDKFIGTKDDLHRLSYQKSELEHLLQLSLEKKMFRSNKVVFHGVYRFQPIHIRLFKELESAGYEVVLLNCYNPDYPTVYECWTDLYKEMISCFPMKNSDFIMDEFDAGYSDYRKCGELFGSLIEGKPPTEKLNNISFIKYTNTMEFINDVSRTFDETSRKDGESRSIGRMQEQFYGVDGTNLNKIFEVFYPEEFGVKPFLSYPIGQFISSLYNMWDSKYGKLRMTHDALIECLNLDIWKGSSPLITYRKLIGYLGLEKKANGVLSTELISEIAKLRSLVETLKEKKLDRYASYLLYCTIKPSELRQFQSVIEEIGRAHV